MKREDVFLLDTRTPEEYALGTIKGAVNIPVDDLRERLSEVPQDKRVVVFCAVGLRGYLAQRILMGHGYKNVVNLSGGYKTYALATQPIINAKLEPVKRVRSFEESMETIKIDACGLQCPGPVIKLKQTMDDMTPGQRVEVKATDAGFPRDAEAWCRSTGNCLVSKQDEGGYHTVVIEKSGNDLQLQAAASVAPGNKTLIMFSDDLDRAIATFVLANGAAATGKKVSIFFTFWGLNVLKKEQKPRVKKDIFGRMFSWMMPSSSKKLKLSQMSMMGAGDKMMRYIMRKKNINSLEELRQQALDNGVEFIACQMTMDMMGISKEELLDGVSIGGVATYMERAEQANVNLFI